MGAHYGHDGVVHVSLEASHVGVEHRLGGPGYERNDASEYEWESPAPETHAVEGKKARVLEVCTAEFDFFGG